LEIADFSSRELFKKVRSEGVTLLFLMVDRGWVRFGVGFEAFSQTLVHRPLRAEGFEGFDVLAASSISPPSL